MNLIFDASALIAFFRDETGAEIVESLLIDSVNTCHVHAINLCEVFYDSLRRKNELEAQRTIRVLLSMGLFLHDDLDIVFWQQVGRYKGYIRHISLADCFCIALAKRLNGSVVTTDHHEFDVISEQGIVPVEFIR
ncbi:MAG: hypothetical protein QG588_1848 [Candidatus Poribacteria bacterium]|nr:hypothetical protein [Candidatus Poribacteria bacterium]